VSYFLTFPQLLFVQLFVVPTPTKVMSDIFPTIQRVVTMIMLLSTAKPIYRQYQHIPNQSKHSHVMETLKAKLAKLISKHLLHNIHDKPRAFRR